MVDKGDVVHGLDPLRRCREGGCRVADCLRDDPGLLREGHELGADPRRVERAARAVVPLDLERAPPLHGFPIRVRHDRDAGGAPRRPAAALGGYPRAGLELDDVTHARHRLRALGVEPPHQSPEHRGPLDRGDEHAGYLHVDAEYRAAVCFARRVEPRDTRAEQAKVLGILERHVLGHGQGGGPRGERAVGQPAPARAVDDLPLLGAARGTIDVPRLRRRRDEHLPRVRARLAQRLPRAADRVAATRAHGARPRRGILRNGPEPDLRPIRFELLGKDHCETGLRSLAHLGLVHGQRDDAV